MSIPSKQSSSISLDSGSLTHNQSLDVRYVPYSEIHQFCRSCPNQILALIDYGMSQNVVRDQKPVSVSINLQQLNEPTMTEVWTSHLPVLVDRIREVDVAYNDEVVFGSIRQEIPDAIDLEGGVSSIYTRLLDVLDDLGHPQLLRIWNYFAGINVEENGLERYKRFCVGRHQAFSTRYREYKGYLPAASAVGTPQGPFQLYFLAGKNHVTHIENPRQISAYDYPKLYGPQSPRSLGPHYL